MPNFEKEVNPVVKVHITNFFFKVLAKKAIIKQGFIPFFENLMQTGESALYLSFNVSILKNVKERTIGFGIFPSMEYFENNACPTSWEARS